MHTCTYVSGSKKRDKKTLHPLRSAFCLTSNKFCNNTLKGYINYGDEQMVYCIVFFCYIRKCRMLSYVALIFIISLAFSFSLSHLKVISTSFAQFYHHQGDCIQVFLHTSSSLPCQISDKAQNLVIIFSFSIKSTKIT